MAITQLGVVTEAFDAATPTSLTVSRTQPTGTDVVMVAIVTTEGPVVHNSVTFDGVGMTLERNSIGSSLRTSLWYLVNPNVVTANVVVSLAASADVAVIVTSWENVNQTTPFSASAAAFDGPPPPAAGTSTSVVVASASGELVIDGFAHNDDGAIPSVGAGQTELSSFEVTADYVTGCSREDGASPNVSMDWTGFASSDWAAVAGSLQPAVVAPGVGANHQMIL